MNITLDTNCIIDLEENRPAAVSLRELIFLHGNKIINLRVVAISASERKPDGTYAANFNEFKQKIAVVGLGHVEILLPIAYLGMAFFDYCYPGGEEATTLEQKIHAIVAPKIEYDYLEYCKRKGIDPKNETIERKWRNAKCDVLAMWSHIRFNGDIFVTSDKDDFIDKGKKEQLIALNAGNILTPKEAVCFIQEWITKSKKYNT